MSVIVGDCSLGDDLEFYCPPEIVTGDLINKDGYLWNASNAAIYLYCEDYPEYSFRVDTFGGLTYRNPYSSGYSYLDLPLAIDGAPELMPSTAHLLMAGILILSALLIICKGGAKRA